MLMSAHSWRLKHMCLVLTEGSRSSGAAAGCCCLPQASLALYKSVGSVALCRISLWSEPQNSLWLVSRRSIRALWVRAWNRLVGGCLMPLQWACHFFSSAAHEMAPQRDFTWEIFCTFTRLFETLTGTSCLRSDLWRICGPAWQEHVLCSYNSEMYQILYTVFWSTEWGRKMSNMRPCPIKHKIIPIYTS